MAVSPRLSPAPPVRKHIPWYVRLQLPSTLPAFLLVLVMVWCVAESISLSGWAADLEVLVPVALMSVLVGSLLVRIPRLPAWIAHILGVLLAVFWIVNQVAPLLGPNLPGWPDHAADLLIRIIALVRVLNSGGRGEDIILFITALSGIAWALGYASSWLTLRRNAAWAAVLLNCLIFLVNYTWVYPKEPHTALFFLLLIAALLLVVQQYVLIQQRVWARSQIEFPELLTWRFWGAAALFILLVVIVTGLLPGEVSEAQANRAWRRLGAPITALRESWEDAFATIQAPPGTIGTSFSAGGVRAGGPRALNDAIVMTVDSPLREYWRAVAFDRYTGVGWSNTTGERAQSLLRVSTPEQARTRYEADQSLDLPVLDGQRVFTQSIRLAQSRKDDVMLVGGDLLRANLPVAVQHSYILAGDGVPLPNLGDISAIFTREALRAGDVYTVTATLTIADRQGLRAAGSVYPDWVAERYLQLPDTVTQRTRDLAAQIVEQARATTPFSVALAIEDYLRDIPYDQQVEAPPPGQDWADYFLFDLRRGYCDYYATAMVVMLRSQGIPARWVQGFASGVYDTEEQLYIVRQDVAHSWPEVYFPGYGWQRFEPTAAEYTFRPSRPELPPGASASDDSLFSEQAPDGSLDPFERELLGLDPELPENSGDAAANPAQVAPPRSQPLDWGTYGLVALLSVLSAGSLAMWLLSREFADFSPSQRAYGELARLAGWAGLAQPAYATPREFASNLKQLLPDYEREIDLIVNTYIAERYKGEAPRLRIGDLDFALRTLQRPLLNQAFQRLTRLPFRN